MDASGPRHRAGLASLTIGALGVVYGDIGTSPLYALRECFDPRYGIPLGVENVLGILSLIFWSLTLVVSIKYLGFILRADNKGEGGILALLAMLKPREEGGPGIPKVLLAFGLIGAALLYGDGVITPAISVLSAIEGLHVASSAFDRWVVPLTIVVLVILFSVQHRGTARIGAVFGPAMAIWFITIATLGLTWIVRRPEILAAIHPIHAFEFFARHGIAGFLVLSAVVLCITGAEALYADMGHFGRTPIRFGWFVFVFPALLLNYFGQGALILEQGQSALQNPFYAMAPGWALYPLVGLATLATVIASQALISGAYSLTQQAIQLGYLPRTQISHTSEKTAGQIFVGQVNQALMLGCLALVLIFRHSSNLAAAYGVAVTGAMLTTSALFLRVARVRWNWKMPYAVAVVGVFLTVDLSFFSANVNKIVHGGWIPIAIAAVLFAVMTTWKRGRQLLSAELVKLALPLPKFFGEILKRKILRVPGTAVFMTLTEDRAPPVLLHHFRHNRVLHERVVLLSIVTKNDPVVEDKDRVRITELQHGFVKVTAAYGFMETPDMNDILIFCLGAGLPLDISELSFYLGRESILTTGASGMPRWRKQLFVFLTRNSRPATDFYRLPPDQVIELGSVLEI